MIRIDRLVMLQAIAIVSAMVAAVVGGLLAQNWIWAIACAIFVYAGFRVAAMIWVSHKIRTDPRWRALRDSPRNDDDDTYGRTVDWDLDDESDWYDDPDRDVYSQRHYDWGQEFPRLPSRHDPGQRAIEADSED